MSALISWGLRAKLKLRAFIHRIPDIVQQTCRETVLQCIQSQLCKFYFNATTQSKADFYN